MQAEFRCRQRFFCERRFHCCCVKALILPDTASFLKAAKKRLVYRLLAFSLCICPVNELCSCFICIKMDFLTIPSPLGTIWTPEFPEGIHWCFGVYAASLDSVQRFASSDDCCAGGTEEQGEEKFLSQSSSAQTWRRRKGPYSASSFFLLQT